MIIRAAHQGDFDDCHALYRALVGEVAVADAAQFARVIGQTGTTIFGAETDGALVSMATLHLMQNMTYAGRPYAFVENVVTLPAYRGKGLARGVMTQIEEVVWAAQGYKIMLLTGRSYGARGFYETLGYDGAEKVAMTKRRAPVRAPS